MPEVLCSEYAHNTIVEYVIVKRKNQKYQIAAIDKDNNVVYNLPLTDFDTAIVQQITLNKLWNL